MFQLIVISLLFIICVLQIINLILLKNKYKYTKQKLLEVLNTEFRYKNIYIMIEYYLRNYEETNNYNELIKNLNNIIYGVTKNG